MKTPVWTFAIVAGHACTPSFGQVAVTEFLNNPDGADKGREWVELFNYSRFPVNLLDWTIGDQGTDSVRLGDVEIAAGGYLIIVSGGIGGLDGATAKEVFEAEWMGGLSHPAVIGVEGMALGNAADEIVLADAAGTPIWSLAYGDDGSPGYATFLTETHDFAIDQFGSPDAPGVSRDGDDNGLVGFAGYQQNDVTPDPMAYESDISMLEALFGEDFATAAEPSLGSPRLGEYRIVIPGDADADGTVGVLDLLLLLTTVGPCPDPCPPSCAADFDADCDVDAADLQVLLLNWTL